VATSQQPQTQPSPPAPKRAVTPPKGRPTPRRTRRGGGRVFGPTFQWIALILLGIVLFVIAFIAVDGGDFNPFNDDSTAPGAQPAGTVV